MNVNVLVVDDEEGILEVSKLGLTEEGFNVTTHTNPEEAFEEFKKNNFDAVITDIRMPEMSGIELLKKCKDVSPDTIVILMTAYSSIDSAIEAIRGGASDYIRKPFRIKELIVRLKEALENVRMKERLKNLKQEKLEEFKIIGESDSILQIKEEIRKISGASSPVLISGESGTGKELVANLIHYNSNRPGKFIPINCSAFPPDLLESELFGYKKGAFTGADKDKEGLFCAANRGTLFLDEISTLPLQLQPKILRAIQQMQFTPLGSTEEIKVDVRIISATNTDIEELVEKGEFRKDLYYRLNVIPIKIPPLRKRKEDIPLLIEHFTYRISKQLKIDEKEFSEDAIEKMKHFSWSGNVRQLKNLVERLLVLKDSPVIKKNDIPSEEDITEEKGILNLKKLEKNAIERALKMADGDKSEAADLLGIHPSTLYRKLKKYNVTNT